MNSTFAEAPGGASTAAAPPAATGLGVTLLTLVRRELWEHRALWIAPLCLTALLAVVATIGQIHIDLHDVARIGSEQQKVALFTIIQWVLAMPLYVLAIFLGGFYLLDCLYAERKDRSILFWKSLPVSDGLTVASKLLVALVVLPFGVFALALVAHLLFTAILGVRVALGNLPAVFTWNTYEWLRTELVMLLATVLAVLWYAPIAAYMLLVSAWARRSPIAWATLPVVLGPLLEWVAFGTRYLMSFFHYRTNGIWEILGVAHAHIITKDALHPIGTALEVLNFRGAFATVDLWLGVAVAVAMAFAATRIRRYRDET